MTSREERMVAILTVFGHDINTELTMILGGLFEVRRILGPEHPAIVDLAESEKAALRCCDMTQAVVELALSGHGARPHASLNYLIGMGPL